MGLKEKLIKIKKELNGEIEKNETISIEDENETIPAIAEENLSVTPSPTTEIENFIIELFSSNDLSSISNTIILYFMSKFNIKNILINMLDEDENLYKPIICKGIKNCNSLIYDFDNYMLKIVNEYSTLEDIKEEPGIEPEIIKLTNENLYIIFPLVLKNDKIGFVSLGKKNGENPLTKEEIEEILKINNIIGVALYNSIAISKTTEKYDNLNLEYKNLMTLIETMKNIQLSDDINEALDLFFNILQDIYKVKTANILIKDINSKIYRTIKSIGLSEETDNLFEITENDETIGDLIEMGESLLVPDFLESDIYQNKISENDKKNVKFLYTVPLKFGNNCIGIFNVLNMDYEVEDEIPSWLERDLSYLPISILPYMVNELK